MRRLAILFLGGALLAGARSIPAPRVSPLQAAVEDAVRATVAEFRAPELRPEQLAVTVIDLRGAAPGVADFRGDERFYPASVIKLFYLAATHRWLEDGKIADTPELRRAMKDMIVDSSNDATHYVIDLLTGTTSGPSSSSQTLGTGFNKLSLTLDRAWLRWEPRYDWRLTGGRMAVPFFGTDLLWPDDLSLDGVAASGEVTVASGAYLYANAGAFAMEEQALSRQDKWLYGLQLGADWTVSDDLQLRVGNQVLVSPAAIDRWGSDAP